jgi:orotidine-5'-phosphate decarboxylase
MHDGRSQIAVALDFDRQDELIAMARRLQDVVGAFKVGLEAFTSHGPEIVRELVALGRPVFLDLKFHDIPNTVGGAIAAATRTGATIINVHASGGSEMMRCAAERARDEAARLGTPPPRVIGVTILTSLDRAGLGAIGFSGSPREAAVRLASLAKESGLDGVVCSPGEVGPIRSVCGPDFFLVVPGIRPAGSEAGDQRRIATPAAAIRSGADLLVIGRPILKAADPIAAAKMIADEISVV